jgi:hypothetical protein
MLHRKLQRIEVILPQMPQQAGDPTPTVPKELDYEMGLTCAVRAHARPAFQLPMDLGLLGRNHLRLGRALVRHRAGPTTGA